MTLLPEDAISAGLSLGDTIPVAQLGATALWLTYLWLASAIAASWISDRKGYGERPGLAAGLLLSAAGLLVWLLVPARQDSRWKREGPLPRRRRAQRVDSSSRKTTDS